MKIKKEKRRHTKSVDKKGKGKSGFLLFSFLIFIFSFVISCDNHFFPEPEKKIFGTDADAVLSSIAVTDGPAKGTYTVGETLNLGGLEVTATYSDGSSKAVTGWTTSPMSGALLGTTGPQTISVSYTDGSITKETSFTVLVNPAGTYTVTFNKNGSGTDPDPKTKNVIAPATTIDELPIPPTWAGYVFTGWNTAADGSGTTFSADTPIQTSLIVYDQWTTTGGWTVTFDSNGGDTLANPVAMSVTPPAKNIDALPLPPSRTGYTFKSWNIEPNGSGMTFNTNSTVERNITVYAQWIANPYTVVYNSNGGSGSMTETSHTYDVLSQLRANTFTFGSYAFVGWNTDVNGKGVSYADREYVKDVCGTAGIITLYAQWEGSYRVVFHSGSIISTTYDLQGVTGTMNEQVFNVNEQKELTANAYSREGFNFIGWSTVNSGSEISYTNREVVKNISVTPGTTVHLYARWEPTYVVGDTGPGGGIITRYMAIGFGVEGYGTPGQLGYFESYTAYYIEAAPEDFTNIWGPPGVNIPGITTNTTLSTIMNTGLGKGRKDTAIIIDYTTNIINQPNTAARLCAEATFGGKDDWFLPSLQEMSTSILNGEYWSSSQFDNNNAWRASNTSSTYIQANKASTLLVRAVRAF